MHEKVYSQKIKYHQQHNFYAKIISDDNDYKQRNIFRKFNFVTKFFVVDN